MIILVQLDAENCWLENGMLNNSYMSMFDGEKGEIYFRTNGCAIFFDP